MQQQQLFYDFGIIVKRRLRLSQIEEILRRTGVVGAVPVRSTLIALIEEGKLDGELTTFGWLVTEDSFKAWVRGFETSKQH